MTRFVYGPTGFVVLVALSFACGAGARREVPAPPTDALAARDLADGVDEPIDIDSVAVQVDSSRASAHVTGVVGDGCSTLLPVEVTHAERDVRVDIRRHRRTSGMCLQLAQLYDEVIPLGTFAPGLYTLQVNSKTSSFRIH